MSSVVAARIGQVLGGICFLGLWVLQFWFWGMEEFLGRYLYSLASPLLSFLVAEYVRRWLLLRGQGE